MNRVQSVIVHTSTVRVHTVITAKLDDNIHAFFCVWQDMGSAQPAAQKKNNSIQLRNNNSPRLFYISSIPPSSHDVLLRRHPHI